MRKRHWEGLIKWLSNEIAGNGGLCQVSLHKLYGYLCQDSLRTDQCTQYGIEKLHQQVVGVVSQHAREWINADSGIAPSLNTSEQAAINLQAKIAVYQCLEQLDLISYSTIYSQ
ncbi:MAG: hypothetical protein EZS28_029587 [Streblomastix strix]|uniref:Uncharacterized protein n=1 Tax=Streblomastix strix TaxID=222440 RepID=A0A5J4UXE6_9EUKA|nr:MAG: hypothetical protein EZS28_029587 [Streblomastix strix]